MLLPSGNPSAHQIRRKELSQGRCHGFQQAALAHQSDVRITRELHAREHRAEPFDLGARKPDALSQPQPQREATLPWRGSVVIVNTADQARRNAEIFLTWRGMIASLIGMRVW